MHEGYGCGGEEQGEPDAPADGTGGGGGDPGPPCRQAHCCDGGGGPGRPPRQAGEPTPEEQSEFAVLLRSLVLAAAFGPPVPAGGGEDGGVEGVGDELGGTQLG